MSEFTDQEITCIDCKAKFVFTAGEQAFFAERNFTPPKRCKACRDARKASRGDRSGRGNDQPTENAVERVFVPDERPRKRKRQREEDYHEVWESPRSRRRKGDE